MHPAPEAAADGPQRPAGPASVGRGFTLLEMLVVLAIVAILATMMVVAFAGIGRRASREGAAENVIGLLRQARISAVDTGRGSLVRVNPAEASLYGLSSDIEAAWHFEGMYAAGTDTEVAGARNVNAVIVDSDGSVVALPGAVGLSLYFDGAADALNCGLLPRFDQTDGIRIEAYVRPEGPDMSELLGVIAKYVHDASYGEDCDGYALWLECTDPNSGGQYAVHGVICIEDQTQEAAASDQYHLDLASYDAGSAQGVTIPGSTWSHVAMEYDGFEARLFVNGVLVDMDSYDDDDDAAGEDEDPNDATDKQFSGEPPSRIRPARTKPLFVALYEDGLDRLFEGRIDEPRLLSIAGGRRTRLPERVPVVASEEVIHFDAQGQLDLSYHSGPVYIGLGDPYQAARLATGIAAGATTWLSLAPRNPFPRSGGAVLVGGELVRYSVGTDTGLNILPAPNGRGQYGTTTAGHATGADVYYARVVRISQGGVVQREY